MPMNDGLNIVKNQSAELNAGTFIYETFILPNSKEVCMRVQQMFVHRREKKPPQGWTSRSFKNPRHFYPLRLHGSDHRRHQLAQTSPSLAVRL